MPWFKCSIEGENFPGVLMQSEQPVGFTATRAVWADSAQEAEFKAVMQLRTEPHFAIAAEHPAAADARVMFESVVEIDEAQAASIPSEGMSWFPMNASESEA